MKNKLAKITDETINNLLQNEIILPSVYFKEFDKNAKTFNVDLEDDKFEKEVNQVIVEEFETINSYMNSTISNLDILSHATEDAKTAIQNRDETELTKIYQHMQKLKNEIGELQNEMFIDPLTKTYNKKWLYSDFIDKNGHTKQNGIMSLIYINDYAHVREEHGSLLSDNLIIFISKFLLKNLKEEGINFKIARYTKDKFLLFFDNSTTKECSFLINNIQKNLLNTTLKSKSGILIKSSYKFNLITFDQGNNFQSMLEMLINDLNNK